MRGQFHSFQIQFASEAVMALPFRVERGEQKPFSPPFPHRPHRPTSPRYRGELVPLCRD